MSFICKLGQPSFSQKQDLWFRLGAYKRPSTYFLLYWILQPLVFHNFSCIFHMQCLFLFHKWPLKFTSSSLPIRVKYFSHVRLALHYILSMIRLLMFCEFLFWKKIIFFCILHIHSILFVLYKITFYCNCCILRFYLWMMSYHNFRKHTTFLP